MSKSYIIVFDREDGVDFVKFHKDLTSLPEVKTWWHYIKSSYIIISDVQSATELSKAIQNITTLKRFLVLEVNLRNRNGLLIPKAWDWFKNKIIKYYL